MPLKKTNESNHQSHLIFFLLAFFLPMKNALANSIDIWIVTSIMFWPLLFLIETAYLWSSLNWFSDKNFSLKRIILAVIIANIISTLTGLYKYDIKSENPLSILGLPLLICTITEWIPYVIILRKNSLGLRGSFDLLRISAVSNLLSHTVVASFVHYGICPPLLFIFKAI